VSVKTKGHRNSAARQFSADATPAVSVASVEGSIASDGRHTTWVCECYPGRQVDCELYPRRLDRGDLLSLPCAQTSVSISSTLLTWHRRPVHSAAADGAGIDGREEFSKFRRGEACWVTTVLSRGSYRAPVLRSNEWVPRRTQAPPPSEGAGRTNCNRA